MPRTRSSTSALAFAPRIRWPSDPPKLIVGARVCILSSGSFGVAVQPSSEASHWIIRADDGTQNTCRDDDLEAICSQLANGCKVNVVERLEMLADPDDPDDYDIVVERGTRGVVSDLDADGDVYIEFESRPGEAVPLGPDFFWMLRFFCGGVWTRYTN
eukprot:TRINITY_DN55102_c0_g1_i1.p1 TRINITY_DN55102_c0_g1~~TRINITY_DN55102_c0_g1_i1.p1  ORF type:complete len:179 (+),score=27.05 TRINITY_DN55102_c0_g1_i1:66-539(+)